MNTVYRQERKVYMFYANKHGILWETLVSPHTHETVVSHKAASEIFKINVNSAINQTLNKIKGDNEYMETLYQVTVVTKKKEIILDEKLVAVDQENAKFKAGLYNTLQEKDLTPADVTVIVTSLGQVKVDKEETTCCKK
ncbi:hypothetical protein D3C87_624510 [compost metagenome]